MSKSNTEELLNIASRAKGENTCMIPMVLELFGHQRIAGYVSEYNFAGAMFVRVDVPDLPGTPALSKMFHPNAIYSMNPVDTDTMMFVAEQCQVKPLTTFDLTEMRRKFRESMLNEGLPDGWENPSNEFDDFNEHLNEKEKW